MIGNADEAWNIHRPNVGTMLPTEASYQVRARSHG